VDPGKLPRPLATPELRAALLAEATGALGGTLDLGRLMSRLTELAAAHLTADAAGADGSWSTP
jgi:hypothetical protein